MISYKSIELPTYVRQLHDKNSYMTVIYGRDAVKSIWRNLPQTILFTKNLWEFTPSIIILQKIIP